MINNANRNGDVVHPLGSDFGGDYPIVQYTNDTLIVMPADMDQLLHLQNLLQVCRLKVNFAKSNLIPINVDETKANLLATVVGCQVGTMPFTY